ncbi:hypothetical protein JW948_08065 [bacterium]|nr:hypothetical protein [bacterium]
MRHLPKIVLILTLLFYISVAAQQPVKMVKVEFTPAEVESMLFLYNQTSIKGADVEVVAPVGTKLRAGLKEARAMSDSTKMLTLDMNLMEVQVCVNIIQASTFEAKYAELVLGMKRKLVALLPPQPAQ